MRSMPMITRLLAGISLAAMASASYAQDIGNVAAVNQDMNGTAPGQQPRLLDLGEGLVQDERIETSSQGSGQLIFLDQTTLTVSANSDITLDTYIFDPNADQGDMALTMTRGAMRFIGGRISKKRRAIVRTPTATIGIRGGLVIIQVAADGSTRVTQLAGESTTVVSYGDADGDGFDDGPSGEALEDFLSGLPLEQGTFIVLSRAGATADGIPFGADDPFFDGFFGAEGDDDDETVPSRRRRRSGQVVYVGIVSSEELAELYEEFEGRGTGGIRRMPSEGEFDEETNEIAEVNSDVEDGDKRQPVSTTGESPEEKRSEFDQPENPLVNFPEVDRETLDELTGENTDPGDQPPDNGGGDNGGGGIPPVVEAIPPAGGFLFIPGEGFSPFAEVSFGSLIGRLEEPIDGVETVEIQIPTSVDQLLPVQPLTGNTFFAQTRFPNSGFFDAEVLAQPGNIEGFSPLFVVMDDNDNIDFAIGEIFVDFGDAPALAVFGNPTPNQSNAFANNTAIPASANSATLFRAEPLIANGPDQDNVVVNIISNGNSQTDGGRFFFAELFNDTNEGVRELSVGAGALGRGSGGPDIDIQVVSAGTDEFGGFFETFAGVQNFGSLADADGNTFFGPDLDFTVLAAPSDGSGEAGFDIVLGQGAAETFQLEPENAFFTRDPAGAVTVTDPLVLASDTTSRATPTIPVLDSVLAAGFATCSVDRECGQTGNYALRPEPQVTQGELSTAGQFDFLPGGVDNNSFQTLFSLSDNGAANIESGNDGPFDQFLFTADAEDSAYLSDSVFGAGSASSSSIIAGNSGNSQVVVASAEAVGADQSLSFPAGIDPTPRFARWGFWAASFDVVDVEFGTPDTDIVDLGTFVAGVRPNPTDFIGFDGTAGFDGPAVGTMASTIARGQTEIVTGSFDLTYDFGQRTGLFTLNVPAAGAIDETVFVSQTGALNSPSYGGATFDQGMNTRIDGVFYSGGGQTVAATGGVFDISNDAANTRTIGIYAGDRK
ncbi:FecR domain-containing protein [Rhodobacteraceae bacterium NNCM2]|nr:FecR domain-containing protein [Coraliihabitans acroporae]